MFYVYISQILIVRMHQSSSGTYTYIHECIDFVMRISSVLVRTTFSLLLSKLTSCRVLWCLSVCLSPFFFIYLSLFLFRARAFTLLSSSHITILPTLNAIVSIFLCGFFNKFYALSSSALLDFLWWFQHQIDSTFSCSVLKGKSIEMQANNVNITMSQFNDHHSLMSGIVERVTWSSNTDVVVVDFELPFPPILMLHTQYPFLCSHFRLIHDTHQSPCDRNF